MDNLKPFAYSTLASGILSTDTAFSFASGEGARFPDSNFNVVIWDDMYQSSSEAYQAGYAEIVRVVTRVGDVATVATRAQELTTAKDFNTVSHNYRVDLCVTPKLFTDKEDALGSPVSADSLLQSTSAGVRSWLAKTYFEPNLGTPVSANLRLSSTVGGVRSWEPSYQILTFSYTGTLNAVRYATFGCVDVITMDLIRILFPMDVVLDRAYLQYNTIDTGARTGGVTIYKDGVATDLVCALTGKATGQRGSVSDLTHSASFSAGVNECSIYLNPGTGNLQNFAFSVRVMV